MDLFLNVFHCYLDIESVTKSKINAIRNLAFEFQDHHNNPKNILVGNHVDSIKYLNQSILLLSLAINFFAKTSNILLFSIYFICWGYIAISNHYYCHAITNKYDNIPYIYVKCQQLGILVSNTHHKVHHRHPHNCNWNFLIGLNNAYEYLYSLTGYNETFIKTIFYIINPVTVLTSILIFYNIYSVLLYYEDANT